MRLTLTQSEKVVSVALSYLGRSRQKIFCCADFVRAVYRSIGIEIPLLASSAPPSEFNIKAEDLQNPPIGHLMFLRDRKDRRSRAWTHVAILLPHGRCIHCSYFFGRKVTISTLDEIFECYDFAPSAAV